MAFRPFHSPATRCYAHSETRRPFIRIAATIAAFAVLWYASFRTVAATRGAVNIIARAVFLVLTCLACIAIGFFLPMAPGLRLLIGGAFWAGLLATAGSLVGMALSDVILAWLEAREFRAPIGVPPTGAQEKKRPRA